MPVFAEEQRRTAVFPFEIYDISSDEWKRSRRLATASVIAALGGRQVGPAVYVQDDGLTDGMTCRDYVPPAP